MTGSFAAAARAVQRVDRAAEEAARTRHAALAKPAGSLGRLEDLGVRLAGIAGRCPPPVPLPAVVAVFAADHGVVARGVTAWPSSVTAAVVGAIVAGTAAVNVIASTVGAEVVVVDVGLATPVAGVLDHAVRRGTADLAGGPAMTRADAVAALDAGAAVAAQAVAGGARCLLTGEVGIGNTTPAAALVAAFTGRPPETVTGTGSGADPATVSRKVAVVAAAVARLAPASDPLDVLAEVGGLELAALAGFVVGGAAARVPVVVDGAIAAAALLTAARLVPGVEAYAVAGHRSAEPASGAVLDALGFVPLLDLGLRLGEGTGALLALPSVVAAARVLRDMATLDDLTR